MEKFLQKKSIRIALIVVAALLVIGLVGGILASMGSKVPASSGTAAKTTVTSTASSSGTSSDSGSSSGSSSSISGSGSSSNSGSSGTGSGSSASSSTPTQYTLTYLPGEYYDGESHCPEPVTVNSGEVVNINFNTHPTRSGYDFVGWATSDGADNPDYEDMEGYRTVTMSLNVTLFPVFHVSDGPSGEGGNGGNQGGGESSLSYGTLNVSVEGIANFGAYHDPDGYDRTDDCEILGTGSDSFSFGDGEYYLFIDYSTDSGAVVTFTGYYEGTYYDNVSISTYYGEDNTATGRYFLVEPYKGYSYWNFSEGDGGTLSIVKTAGGH